MKNAAALIAKIRKRAPMRLGYAEIVYLTIAERDLIVAALSTLPCPRNTNTVLPTAEWNSAS